MTGRPSGLIMIMPAQPPRMPASRKAGRRGGGGWGGAPVGAHHDQARPAAAHAGIAEGREAGGELLAAERHVVRVHAFVELLRIGVAPPPPPPPPRARASP